jgi:hypothetical protein
VCTSSHWRGSSSREAAHAMWCGVGSRAGSSSSTYGVQLCSG